MMSEAKTEHIPVVSALAYRRHRNYLPFSPYIPILCWSNKKYIEFLKETRAGTDAARAVGSGPLGRARLESAPKISEWRPQARFRLVQAPDLPSPIGFHNRVAWRRRHAVVRGTRAASRAAAAVRMPSRSPPEQPQPCNYLSKIAARIRRFETRARGLRREHEIVGDEWGLLDLAELAN
jgi:hypothetical protein